MQTNPSVHLASPLTKTVLALALGCASTLAAHAAPLIIPAVANDPAITNYTAPDLDNSQPAYLSLTADLSVPQPITFAADTTEISLNISAPDGYQFVASALDGPADFSFAVYCGRFGADADTGLLFAGAPTVSFLNLTGTAPTLNNYSSFGFAAGSGGNTYLLMSMGGSFTDSFSFTGLEVTFPLAGSGNAVDLTLRQVPQLFVQDYDYNGSAVEPAALLSVAPVPEPSAAVAVFVGAGVILSLSRRRRVY